jgi:hypothetical protein
MRFTRRLRASRPARWLALGWPALFGAYHLLDFVLGKVGWLGVFTAPEDFAVMLERAPAWLERLGEIVGPTLVAAFGIAGQVLRLATSFEALFAVLVIIAFIVSVDIEALERRASLLRFRARALMTDRVWIDTDAAREVLRRSDWGRVNAPHVVERVETAFTRLGILAGLGGRDVTDPGMSERERAAIEFRTFLDMALLTFADANPDAVREDEAGRSYDENDLRRFAQVSLEAEVRKKFGDPPSHRVR